MSLSRACLRASPLQAYFRLSSNYYLQNLFPRPGRYKSFKGGFGPNNGTGDDLQCWRYEVTVCGYVDMGVALYIARDSIVGNKEIP